MTSARAVGVGPRLPPRVLDAPSLGRRLLVAVGLVALAPVALMIGLLLAALALAGLALAMLIWLLRAVWAWCWFLATRGRHPDYPFRLRPPTHPAARLAALRDARMHAVPFGADAGTRLIAFLLAPTALTISVLGIFLPSFRARPYFWVFTPPRLVAKFVRLAEMRGLLVDGTDAVVRPYDEWLRAEFPEIPQFVAWWRSSDPAPYDPLPPASGGGAVTEAGLDRLQLGAHPDPLGHPGLAMAAIRRRSVRSLRELFVSQNEVDDRGDPDLDDRADAGIIRIVERVTDTAERVWIVHIPSTQSFDPRSGLAPNDITAGLVASSGNQPTLARAVLSAMAQSGIRAGERVLISGFSLGGIIAAELATTSVETGYAVTHVITAGAPTGRAHVPQNVRVLSFEHALDAFPRLDGRRNPVDGWITVTAGPPVPHQGRLGFAHHLPSYAETAASVEAEPPDARVREFLDTARDFFGPGQTIHDFAATRADESVARPALPVLVRWVHEDGITARTLQAALRRVSGVVAVDIYASHIGYPTAVRWNADILIERLEPWLRNVDRRIVYRSLVGLLEQRRAVGLHLRIQARDAVDVTWEATLHRTGDGRWHERVGLDFAGPEAEQQSGPLIEQYSSSARVGYYPEGSWDDATFEPA
ncbi:hypothetical protein [Planctomonas psychrotolerans]|uniref:hypothetical protein n=1 Tax=Planctomonas psychrotolerans TaxID=2528712 RepID=UPI00123BBAE2|nr:hypothetical protein [Planctomonas psychrotolerans]